MLPRNRSGLVQAESRHVAHVVGQSFDAGEAGRGRQFRPGGLGGQAMGIPLGPHLQIERLSKERVVWAKRLDPKEVA